MSLREVVLDTETTGLDPRSGHRIIEIGCLELVNFIPSGEVFHTYVNPERGVPRGAFEIHGLSGGFLKQHPVFSDIVELFMGFVGDSPLVIHNASFDLGFLDTELNRLGMPPLQNNKIIDTLALARLKFPGSPASLDALCKRFQINRANRIKHGALIDAKLLAAVYLELIGGKQRDLVLGGEGQPAEASSHHPRTPRKTPHSRRPHKNISSEVAAHNALVNKLKLPIWKD